MERLKRGRRGGGQSLKLPSKLESTALKFQIHPSLCYAFYFSYVLPASSLPPPGGMMTTVLLSRKVQQVGRVFTVYKPPKSQAPRVWRTDLGLNVNDINVFLV